MTYLTFQFIFLILGWVLIFINFLFVDHEDKVTSDTLRYFSMFCFAMSIVFAVLSLTS